MSRGAAIAVALAVASAAGCAQTDAVFDPKVPELPASTFVRSRPVRPAILGVWLSGGRDQDLGLIVRFSEPMDRDSVAAHLAVVAATATVTGPRQGQVLEPTGALEWNPTATEFLAFFAADVAERAVVVTFDEGVFSQSNIALDGTSGPRPGTDANSFHRFEDDGFSGPAPYVSLPYLTGDGRDLAGQPSFLQHDMRPGVSCVPFAALGEAVTTGALGFYDGGLLVCRMWDRRRVLERPGKAQRVAPRAWASDGLPQAVFVRARAGAGTDTVAGEVRVGRGGHFDPRTFWTVAETVGAHGLQIQGLNLAGDVDIAGLHFAPADAPEPLWAITGVTLPDILWTNPVLAAGMGAGAVTIVDNSGQAWIADEFAGQTFFNGLDATARIRSNRANVLELDSVASCPQCPYQIRTDIKRRYGVGSQLRIVGTWFTLAPAAPLARGEWVLRLTGGRDLWGMELTDGIRDGDEVAGVADHVVEFSLTVP